MQHGVLPRTLHAQQPSPHIDWTAGNVALLTEQQPWPPTNRPRRAAVSSFGISGTNAHVILEQAEPAAETPADHPDVPLIVSGRTPQAVRDQAAKLADWLDTHDVTQPGLAIAGRPVFEHSAIITGDPRAVDDAVFEEKIDSRLGIAFTGQGSQRAGMGQELYERFPVYRQAYDEVAAALRPYVDIEAGDLNDTAIAQPALFAVETALYRLLES
ncbi:ketoacyl-synthetase C-terminal extension domain-containing protein, partial [Paractinoplanes ferrugineus]|uniref:ketoacyl-synthetase C-terminal extension domain-containing protein n=1 Tax=Paractinoplanes ferrugineus TaxID=113564 RepID=UPI0031DB5C1C